jgi:bifunctional non-homologous end joining protein LigD
MSLTKYNLKRSFDKTDEPEGKKPKKTRSSLIFVVQQHAASHLHYDFRLEMEGVLKSWAVPKGPSLNPDDKRLAMMVEDHPYDYKDFEGTIPEGNYGAGNVIVWDSGTYHSILSDEKVESEKELLKGLKKGHISFILEGTKLKGEFALIKMRGRSGKEWLLVKKKDKFAKNTDILKKNKSIISGKPLVLRLSKEAKKKAARAVVVKKKIIPGQLNGQGVKRKIEKVKPMLAELKDKPFDNDEWVFEIKYDGYRTLALINKDKTELYSRNLISFNENFGEITVALSKIKDSVLLDGEVVAEAENGRSDFQKLQNYQRNREGHLKYFVFDILHLNGYDLTSLPLLDRKNILKDFLAENPVDGIIFSDHFDGSGIDFFEQAKTIDLEGIIAKKKDSIYLPGSRSGNWFKIKTHKQQEAVITGITEPQGGRKHFGSLLLAVYEDGKLVYSGNCGTGFNQKTLDELYRKFKPLFTEQSPFRERIKATTEIQWIKPKLVCEVKFSEWTKDGIMRHPVFLGLRIDKSPTEVKREIPKPVSTVKKSEVNSKNKSDLKTKTNKKSEADVNSQAELLKIGKVTLQLTNQDKLYWQDEKITKGELVQYYREIAPIMLPYLNDRPQSMHRFPNGIRHSGFFQKDVDVKKSPDWLHTEKIYSESTDEYINYLICNDAATLVYMANLGCIEINPWNSKYQTPENPDWIVIDFDPEEIRFTEVVKAANVVREIFEELGVQSYCKTSGATGLHVYVPLAGKYDYDIVKTFAELIATTANRRLPETTSIMRSPSKRKGKVYLDFLQNRRGQTLAAPYSVRPKPGATVSTPLEWDEVNSKLIPAAFTMKNILKRIEKKGDLWKPVIGKGIDIRTALKKLNTKI